MNESTKAIITDTDPFRGILALVCMRLGDRHSFEYTVLVILEYFVRREALGAITKYHVMNRIPGLPSQRQDRVSAVLDLLVQRGWLSVESRNDGGELYKITEAGKAEYDKWVKEFLAFVKVLRTGKHDSVNS